MIFVTVGTHEQQFNRLIKAIDDLKKNKIVKEKVFIQTGFSNYKPQHCDFKDFLTYDEMNLMLKQSRIIITHGGPSSFIPVLQFHKIPIVVPRNIEFSEHVNNHQLEFIKELEQKSASIIPVYNIETIGEVIENYNILIKNISDKKFCHNNEFCKAFVDIVDNLNIKS